MDSVNDVLPAQSPDQNDLYTNRPISRRGIKTSHKDDARTERPLSRAYSTVSQDSLRPASGIARIQGTASRLASAVPQQRNISRTISPPRLHNQLDVTDRLITQQGLSSRPKSSGTGLKGPGKRQILDKRYYEGLLQLKIKELTDEITTLRKDIEVNHKERDAFAIYDKQNKELATELATLQGTLADYNLVLDKLHIGTEIKDIDSECESLKMSNDKEQIQLEQLFTERTQTQLKIQQLEEELGKERHLADEIVKTMPLQMKEKYENLANENSKLQQTTDKLQKELDDIVKQKTVLQQRISDQPLKQEAVKLELQIMEAEERRHNLLLEENENNSEDMREKYLNQIKNDNAEIAAIERSINQVNEELKNCEKQLEQLEQDLEECQSDRHKKYLELRKREETIETFLSTYDELRNEELKNLAKLKSDIAGTMNAISQHMVSPAGMQNEYDLINTELLQIDDFELNQQKSLFIQFKQKKLYLEKLQLLETKLQNESDDLQEQIEQLRSELITFTDLDSLKDTTEQKRKELLAKKAHFLEIRDSIQEKLEHAKHTYEKIHAELEENETYKQLNALERKLVVIEQDTFALKENINDKKCIMNYGPIKENVIELVKNYNNKLKERYNNTHTI